MLWARRSEVKNKGNEVKEASRGTLRVS